MSPSFLIKNTIAAFLLPPMNGLLLIALGAWLQPRRKRLGRSLLISGIALLYLLSTQLVANGLTGLLEPAPISAANLRNVDAIVCLGGGKRFGAYDQPAGETVNNATLVRLRYCAQLARASGKPVLVSGGAPIGGIPEADLMAAALREDFQIQPRWIENGSDDTAENARLSARMLLPPQRRIALVSQAWHLPRAEHLFVVAGFEVTPAPTDFANREPFSLLQLLPKAKALYESSLAIHELVGLIWYRLR
ncbi:YdcF family protein [Andreprevotia chitinilytica]|uniref:YdcF family protein n=1 Tax=Andreprevotia chitinilytica TaxID=396808 RepID=UPI0005596483|nr:YdcF family protein [Andreprevotia chitinilytica]